MDCNIKNMGHVNIQCSEDFEIVPERSDEQKVETPLSVAPRRLYSSDIVDRRTTPTSIVAPSEMKGHISLSHLADLPLDHVSDAIAKTIAKTAFFEGRSVDVARLLQRDFAITDRQMQETVDPFIAVGIAQRAWQTEGSLATESARWRSGDTHFNARVEDAFIAMLPAHWRRGGAWALSLSDDASLAPRIRDSARVLLQHFERDTLDFIRSLPEKTDDTVIKFRGLYSMIAPVQQQSTWLDLWSRAREMPWCVQPALMHRLAARLPCPDTSVRDSTSLVSLYGRWQRDMSVRCIAHDSGFLLSRSYAAVIQALAQLSAFDAPAKMPILRRQVASALQETPVHARAEVLDVLVNLDLSKLGPESDVLTRRVPSNLHYLVRDPSGRATCPSARFADALCDTAVKMWDVLPDSGDPLDEKITAFCQRFDLGAEHAMSLRSRLSAVSRQPDRRITQAPIVNPDDFDFPGSTYDRTAAKL